MPSTPAAPFAHRVTRSLGIVVAFLAGGFALGRAAAARDFESIYAPLRVEQATLSPDGKHVAFSIRLQRRLEVHIFDTTRPGDKAVILLDRERNATTRILNWISPDQLLAVSSTPNIIVTDSTGRSVQPVNLANLFRQSAADDDYLVRPDARIIQAPDDPACLLFESNVPVPASEDGAGIPGRPRLLEMHRLNVLTGEATRLLDLDVEKETPVGATVIDRRGKPRLVYRYGAEPPYFGYRDAEANAPRGFQLSSLFGDAGWRSLDRVLPDRSTFSFFLAPENILKERTVPLGFDSDPNLLFFASNLGRDTYAIYTADLRSGKRTEVAFEELGVDLVDPDLPWMNPPLVFDRHRTTLVGVNVRKVIPTTRWLDPELKGLQDEIEKKFPSRIVRLLDWDTSRGRVLALIGSLGDPGRYFVYQRSNGQCVEYLRRAPSLPSNEINPTEAVDFTTPAGVRITGYLTLPRDPGKVPPPVVVSLHDGPWQRTEAGYDRDAQALATFGFAVVKINYRGSAGFGIAHREAIRTSLDRAPIDDVLATLEWIRARRYRADFRRVGLIGEGYGGYLALRALQLHPETFQSAVVINGLTTPLDLWISLEPDMTANLPPPDSDAPPPKAEFKPPGVRQGADPTRALATWLVSRQSGLGAIAVTANLKLLSNPVFLLHDPNNRAAPYLRITSLRASLRRQNRAPDLMEITKDFAQPDSPERMRAFRRIGEFFNLTLHDFKVRVGEATEKLE